MERISVHIADDHQVLIDGIVAVLKTESSIDVVGHSLNGQEVVDWFNSNDADVLVLDINMPKLDGFEVLNKLQDLGKQPKTVVLSSYDDVKIVKEVLKIGAKGFVAKNAAADQIIEAIKSVNNGKQYYSEHIKEKIINIFYVDDSNDKAKEKEDTQDFNGEVHVSMLTERERDVLKLISQEYSTKEISEELHIAVSTAETHRRNLIKKLNVKNSVGLALFALKNKL